MYYRSGGIDSRLSRINRTHHICLGAGIQTKGTGDARHFANGRQLAAWLGLVPRQHSSGGKQTLLGISKRGDSYLRTLLIHGARAVIRCAERKAGDADRWLAGLLQRRHKNVATVALANKNARTAWALLAHDRAYVTGYTPAASSRCPTAPAAAGQ